MHFSGFFSDKAYCKVILKRKILGSHTISDQSLLLSTIVLNDTIPYNYAKAKGEMYVWHCGMSLVP